MGGIKISPVFDHIVAMLIVSLIFVGAVVIMPNVNLGNLQAVEQQQLWNTALNVFNAMLLDIGYPEDWGSQVDEQFYFNSKTVKRFGLSSHIDSTFYTLDPDKVQRLDTTNPIGFLKYEELRELLELKNYGFSFRIIPPFNVTNVNGTKIDEQHAPLTFVNPPTNSILKYALRVFYLDGSPIPNAVIEGNAFYSKGKDFGMTTVETALTDALGIGTRQITLGLANPDFVIVVLRISVAGVAAILVTLGKDASVYVADINIVGDNVVLTKAKNPSNEDVKLNEIFVYTSNGTLFSLYNGTQEDHFNTGSGEHSLWSKTFGGLRERDPAIFIFNFDAVEKGRKEIIVAGPYNNLLGYNIFEYGGSIKTARAAIRIQRSVIISGMIYTTELWLWKESS